MKHCSKTAFGGNTRNNKIINKREFTMKTHKFTLILTTDPNEEEADRFYSI